MVFGKTHSKLKKQMKTEINNENKARFFALYWGQDVLKWHKNFNVLEKQKIEAQIIHWIQFITLELKPLSSISDEDAEFINLQSEDYNEDGWFDDGEFYWWASIDVDYLRSKGYAMPFMELSVEEMVEAKWIHIVESNKINKQ